MSVPGRATANVSASVASADATLSGARETRSSLLLGRLVSLAAARELRAFVVPGPEIARARGLDLETTSLRVAPTPRHASVLLVVGGLPEGLRRAATVAYAQMPRPRAVLAVDAQDVWPLPGPDVSVGLGEGDLAVGAAELRRLFAEGAFDPDAEDFEAAALRGRTEYVCPMHPEVVQDEPGTCPKCGMELVARGAENGGEEHTANGGHDGEGHARHGGMERDENGVGSGEDGDRDPYHDESGQGDEQEQDDVVDETGHGGHESMDHGGHEGHGEMGFMSMVEMTEGTPRSSDGLQMEWVETPFGPLFPGLPGGLSLTLTLDGDSVAEAGAGSAVGAGTREDPWGPVEAFVERLARLDPLSPASYRLLALRAVENAAGAGVDGGVELARVGQLERERAASHLGWLADFGYLIGYHWLARRGEKLQLALLRADTEGVAAVRVEVRKLARRVERTPLLRSKLAGVGGLPDPAGASGPVARAGGRGADARTGEEVYLSLDFRPVVEAGGDALARLRVRLAEAQRSLELVQRAVEASVATSISDPGSGALPEVGASGSGAATVETPRGAATLRVTLREREVTAAELETPQVGHTRLVGAVTEGRELADALVGVASLDLSPWGMERGTAG